MKMEANIDRSGGDSPMKSSQAVDEIPICCQLDPDKRMFRIIRAKGKALASGGFGIAIPDEDEKGEDSNAEGSECAVTSTAEYLFPEEVLFLHDRGLLECHLLQKTTGDKTNSSTLDSSQLFQMLPSLGMSLAMYLVYSHLRSQDFRVIRHCPQRIKLLRQQESVSPGDMPRKQNQALRREVRKSIAESAAPTIDERSLSISWDAYNPNAQFGKTHPGFPDFYVAATYYSSEGAFSQVHDLVKSKCYGIPLKLATVSDSGTVVMFGVTDIGVPDIKPAE